MPKKKENKEDAKDAVSRLMSGGVGVLRTDTVYGLVARADCKEAIDRIYSLKGRDGRKPFIILISKIEDLKIFGVCPGSRQKNILRKIWPGKFSVILPCRDKKFAYLHRGSFGLAFRLPKRASLTRIIEKTGPLVAPSANPQGLPTAKTVAEAKKYFGKGVDFYLDGGYCAGEPSALVEFCKRGRLCVIRGKMPKSKSLRGLFAKNC